MTRTFFKMFSENKIIYKITDESLKIAKDYVTHDKLVAFPTETVYGLGANALSDEAIKAVYTAKGRPLDNPLIVHVPPEYDITKLVYDDEPYVKKLRDAFLPGPLTLVYRSKNVVSGYVSCGLETLAIRVPSHAGAQAFLRAVSVPVAAPSANISKHTSPVTAMHVYNDFKDKIPMILDGGRSDGGIESTVMDVTGEYPVILRKGLVTADMVEKIVGKCTYASSDSELNKRSPGTKYRHYCPNTKTALYNREEITEAKKLYLSYVADGKTACILCDDSLKNYFEGCNLLNLGKNGNEMAARLYYCLHEGEKYDILIGIRFEIADEVCLSVENRFLKAFG